MMQHYQVEVAGTAITLSDEEAALVVYMDNSQCGKNVRVRNGVDLQDYSATAQVIERSVEDEPICAAVFPRLPINSHLKPYYEGQRSGSYEVDCIGFNLNATITLFVSNVAELDWRRRK